MSTENDSSQVQDLAADSGFQTFPVAPGYRVNVRSGPGTNYSVIDVLPYGASVTIRCQSDGTTVSGPYGTSDIWDCVGNGRFVSDAYVKTGSDGYVATHCG
ncbi:SH3 domain-containing protein [Streptomyces sp. NPDC058290]|uniref:SH3 domain-containing protein n=1 Tax=unclassified Streptomyces TaxID=2593676 RepID=UPI000A6F6F1E|nr:SH3 domain-containing protein [Streptomyces sp. NBC_00320]MCX5146240.1 SH3 domain-containing protein [Streptomyces sp. NBC_00320]WSW61140.1 SH3 domain-containing protein [Streptomyces sp. NBC_00998]